MTPSPEDVERMIERLRARAERRASGMNAQYDRVGMGWTPETADPLSWEAADMLAALSAIGGGK